MWSPSGWPALTRHSRWATASRNFSGPPEAKRRDQDSWPSWSTLTPKRPEACRAWFTSERWSTHTRIRGGSRLTEQNAFAVRPAGRPAASRVVTTVMPLANCPRAWRNARASTAITTSGGPGGPAVERDLAGQQGEAQADPGED